MREDKLADIIVVDLSRALAGPHAAMMLADMGARVIKVESPRGDDSRSWGPPFVGNAEALQSTYFMACNRNKESLTADLKVDAGKSVLCGLIKRADVLIENFRPGVLARLGFDDNRLIELNPQLVVLSISGFGHDGPQGGRAGYDQIAQGESGLMSLTGTEDGDPTRIGVPISDLLAGIYGAFGVVTALHQRQRTGRGAFVRTSLLAAAVGIHSFQGTRWTVAREMPHRTGNYHPSIAPYGLFRAGDGPIQIACGNELMWERLSRLLGIAHARYATNQQRVTERASLTESINEVLTTNPAEHWIAEFDRLGIPAGRVRTIDEVYGWDQTRSQGLLIEVNHPRLGTMELPGSPLRFDGVEPQRSAKAHSPPPLLGEHTNSVLEWLSAETSGGVHEE